MHREAELASLREQVSILAEQVTRLMEVISIRASRGWTTKTYEEQAELAEALLWKLHRRYMRLKSEGTDAQAA